ncbi:MAG: 1,2-phenylacetyl-CoA epoxidase subunit PaaD [Tumebacillaceae bacterium]
MTQHAGALREEDVWNMLQEIKDPEIPVISMVEMGMINKVAIEGSLVTVEVLPTFVGCPAIEIMRTNIAEKLREVEGVSDVHVNFVFEPAWTSDRITDVGREKLNGFGIAPPPKQHPMDELEMWEVNCPFCGSKYTKMENLFGPAACRSILYCETCKNPFEAIKPV